MLSEHNSNRLIHYLNKVKYSPAGREDAVLLRESEKYLNDLVLYPNQLAYVIDISKGIISCNKGFDSFLGFSQKEMDLFFLFGLFHPDDQDEMLNILLSAYDFGLNLEEAYPFCVHFIVSYRIRKSTGDYVKVLRQSSIFQTDLNGRMISNSSICSDISHLNSDTKIKFIMHGKKGESFVVPDLKENKGLHFTKRESELVSLISQGLSTKQIANQLGLSIFTVETQRKNMLKKFDVKNTFQLVFWAKENQLI
ncbi:hypothetical protein BH10BAC1_BH10BAC1_02110 [soil metagenome]